MSRDLTTAMVSQVTSDSLSPVYLILIELDSGDIRFWTGYGDLTYNLETYLGVGNILGISDITESEDIVANGVTVSLSGLNSTIISASLSENYQGRPVTIFFGAFDDVNRSLIADPIIAFKGELDVMQIDDTGDTVTVAVQCESDLITLKRPKERRYTSKDQQLDYPTDKFFDNVPTLQDAEVTWGRS